MLLLSDFSLAFKVHQADLALQATSFSSKETLDLLVFLGYKVIKERKVSQDLLDPQATQDSQDQKVHCSANKKLLEIGNVFKLVIVVS